MSSSRCLFIFFSIKFHRTEKTKVADGFFLYCYAEADVYRNEEGGGSHDFASLGTVGLDLAAVLPLLANVCRHSGIGRFCWPPFNR